jgi:hypothetical protein
MRTKSGARRRMRTKSGARRRMRTKSGARRRMRTKDTAEHVTAAAATISNARMYHTCTILCTLAFAYAGVYVKSLYFYFSLHLFSAAKWAWLVVGGSTPEQL